MGLFDFIGSVSKAVVNVAVTPIEVVKDAVTLGGAITNQDEPYTVQRLKKAMKNLDDADEELE